MVTWVLDAFCFWRGRFLLPILFPQLIEEIMFIRNLRRELSSITAAFSDGGSGMEPQGTDRAAGRRSSAGGMRGRDSGGSDGSLSLDIIGAGLVAIASSAGNGESGEQHEGAHVWNLNSSWS